MLTKLEISAHASILTEIVAKAKSRSISDIIQLEDDILGVNGGFTGTKQLETSLQELYIKLQHEDQIRIVLLWYYAFKTLPSFLPETKREHFNRLIVKMVGEKSNSSKLSTATKTIFNKLKTTVADNLVERKPIKMVLPGIVKSLASKTLSEIDFPVSRNRYINTAFQRIYVYVVGGITYDEIEEIKKIRLSGLEIMIGSDKIINGDSVVKMLDEC